jgi:hypothetical protein
MKSRVPKETWTAPGPHTSGTSTNKEKKMSFTPDNVVQFSLPSKLGTVEVVDRIMGSGKSYATLRYIEGLVQADPDERWIFCTELLDELFTRTTENSNAETWHLPDPDTDDAGSKTESLKNLLREPGVRQIGITHSLLLKAARDREVLRLIASKGYRLFLDETIELIKPYAGIEYEEFRWHMDQGRLEVDTNAYGKVTWTDATVEKHNGKLIVDKLREEEDRVHAARIGDKVRLVWIEDDAMFRAFSRVILATYQFENTFMDAWLRIKGIPWVPCSSVVCARTTSKEAIRGLVGLISKYDKKFERLKLTSRWFEKATKKDFDLINRTIRSIGDSQGCKGEPALLAYTVPRSSIGSRRDGGVQPRGYGHTKCMPDSPDQQDLASSCHIACNARASNAWADKTVMVHVFNRYPNPVLTDFLDKYEVTYSGDRFALNELVQWLWRSAIRNGEPIKAAILSKRMRGLFLEWLAAPDVQNVVSSANDASWEKSAALG